MINIKQTFHTLRVIISRYISPFTVTKNGQNKIKFEVHNGSAALFSFHSSQFSWTRGSSDSASARSGLGHRQGQPRARPHLPKLSIEVRADWEVRWKLEEGGQSTVRKPNKAFSSYSRSRLITLGQTKSDSIYRMIIIAGCFNFVSCTKLDCEMWSKLADEIIKWLSL
jgi:hypothetical protein